MVASTGDIEYIQECLETLKLDFNDRLCLVCAIKKQEIIKKFWLENEKRLDGDKKVQLILATNDTKVIKQCVEDESLALDDVRRAKLIVATKDVKYIKTFMFRNTVSKYIWNINQSKYTVFK